MRDSPAPNAAVAGADLMAGEHPAEHEVGALATEARGGDLHCRRDGDDPVEALEDGEQREPAKAFGGAAA